MRLNKGFIALITVIIISVVLLGLVSASNTAGYFSRFNRQEAEYKRMAFALAESCGNMVLLHLAQNYSYTIPQHTQVVLGPDTCIVESLQDVSTTPSSRTVLITTSAHYVDAFSAVEIEAAIANPAVADLSRGSTPAITIISWKETK